jgi:UDP-N-acetyl-D-mannosaminuronate dehydrogenase
VVHLLQGEGAQVKAWEPFKPDAKMHDIQMAVSLDDAIKDAELIILLVKHTEFAKFDPQEIAKKTNARIVLDTVNGWDREAWKKSGFQFFRIGDGKSKS